MLEQANFNFQISYDKNDKDSIYIVDLVGYLLGIDAAKEHLLEFYDRQIRTAQKMKELEAKLPEMLELIDKYFNG